MKKFYVVLALLMCLSFAKNVSSMITIEIVDQETPTAIYNGEYRELLEVQITTENGDLAQLRCPTFFIDNTFSYLSDLRFEDLQWKEGNDWVAASKVDAEWNITVPCWFICLPNQTKIITLWGKVVSIDVIQGQGEFQIGWDSAEYLWISGNPVIVNNFPQHKNIIIVGETSADNDDISNVTEVRNFPNPFNPITMISFYLASVEDVKLEIYNIKGQKVKTLINEELSPGQHKVSWDGTDDSGRLITSGVYFYKMKAGSYTATNKMILMK